MSENSEIELKATFHPEQFDRIKNLPAIKKHAFGRTRSRKLHTVYYDTPDYALRRQGLSLRVREIGNAYVQCVKQTDKQLGCMLVRDEWEGPVPSQDPAISVIDNKTLRGRIKRAGGKDLRPVFQTDIQRTSRALRFEDGSTATLDLDIGEIVAGDDSAPICELELELDSGAPEWLFDLASEIRKAVPFRLATLGKATRGYALITQDILQPSKPTNLDLAKDATVEQVLTEVVQHCLDHLQANEPFLLTSDDTEGVHQVRVALRRMRAALQLFKSALPEEQFGWIVAEAKWLTGELSAVRAWDVFAEEFVAPVATFHSADEGFDALSSAVNLARQQSYHRARDVILSERYTDFLLRVSAWLSSRAWRKQAVSEQTARLLDPIVEHCSKLLRKRDSRVRKQCQKFEDLSDAELHELRLAVKKLRYAVDFFENLYPTKRVKPYRKRLAKLQDGLGYLNDVVTADALAHELAGKGEKQLASTVTYAGGLTVGWHRHAALAVKRQLAKDVSRFLVSKPFWLDA